MWQVLCNCSATILNKSALSTTKPYGASKKVQKIDGQYNKEGTSLQDSWKHSSFPELFLVAYSPQDVEILLTILTVGDTRRTNGGSQGKFSLKRKWNRMWSCLCSVANVRRSVDSALSESTWSWTAFYQCMRPVPHRLNWASPYRASPTTRINYLHHATQ